MIVSWRRRADGWSDRLARRRCVPVAAFAAAVVDSRRRAVLTAWRIDGRPADERRETSGDGRRCATGRGPSRRPSAALEALRDRRDDPAAADGSARAAARAALDDGHPIAAIAAAEADGERAARERVGAQVLRSVERSAKKMRESTEEYERAIVAGGAARACRRVTSPPGRASVTGRWRRSLAATSSRQPRRRRRRRRSVGAGR